MAADIKRRLAAMLAAQAMGYSRLMGDDETRRLAALKSHRMECVGPKIGEHPGRIVKVLGDLLSRGAHQPRRGHDAHL